MIINQQVPPGEEIINLLIEHHHHMLSLSPPESVHALDTQALKSADVTFWGAWIDGELAGCGGLLQLDPQHGEIKSMRTAQRFLRQGVAVRILESVITEATTRGYQRLSLETGSDKAFRPARELYLRHGFAECAPFGSYSEDPHSVFMTLKL
ncbi:MAG: GNAT family N-acetyltransferase [Pseudomonadota bacterium]